MNEKPSYKIKMLVACHKEAILPSFDDNIFLPIQVGRADALQKLDMTGDDTGDNISKKNSFYAEVTALYWAWKNLKDVDLIGLCHYRRFFDFHKQIPQYLPSMDVALSNLSSFDVNIPTRIMDLCYKGGIVVAKPTIYPFNLMTAYCIGHISDDFRTLESIIKKNQPTHVVETFYEVMYNNNKFIPCNMFIMKKEDFDNYCEWLFPILFEMEENIEFTHYNEYQSRVLGFMSERLFNVWLKSNQKKLIFKPIIRFTENQYRENFLKYIFFQVKSTISFLALKLFRANPRINTVIPH